MLSEKEIREMYEDELERCVGHYFVASRDKSKEELYEAHVWTLSRLGTILGIADEDSFAEIKARVKRVQDKSVRI